MPAGGPDVGSVHVNGHDIPVSYRRSARARRISLRLSLRHGLEIVVPLQVSVGKIDVTSLVNARLAWIERAHDRLLRHQKTVRDIPITSGTRLDILGREVEVLLRPSATTRSRETLSPTHLTVTTPGTDQASIRRVLMRLLLALAKEIIPEKVRECASPAGLVYKRVTIRNQATRWGSCSRRGTLSFNWRLVLCPPFVMEYLIYHELAHLREMNHSVKFWRLVGTLCPLYREAEAWLRTNGGSLPLGSV